MFSIEVIGQRVAVLLLAAAMVACGSSNGGGAGDAASAGGTSGSNGGAVGKAGSGGQGTGVVIQDNHCVMKVSGANVNSASYNITGPIAGVYPKGVDARYDRSLDKTGFYCLAAAASVYSADVSLDVSGQLEQLIPYIADETTGNYIDVSLTYSLVPSLDETKRQWWSCHAGKDQISNSGAKGDVGQFSVALDAATPQNYIGGKPDDYLIRGTIHAECPPFTPGASSGVAGTGTLIFDLTFD